MNERNSLDFWFGVFLGGIIGGLTVFFTATDEGRKLGKKLLEEGEEKIEDLEEGIEKLAKQGKKLIKEGGKLKEEIKEKMAEKGGEI